MNDVSPTTNIAPMKFGMGANPRRKEDKALVTGAGRFVDDHTPVGTLHAWVLRSTMAHARISLGDLSAARGMPGVRLILTAADVKGIGGLPCKGKVRQVDGTYPKFPPHPILVGDVVRHVGDPIAFIVADHLEQAKAVAEAIEIDYDPMPVVVDMKAALAKGAPLVWPEFTTNVAFEVARGARQATETAFANAAKVSKVEIVNNR